MASSSPSSRPIIGPTLPSSLQQRATTPSDSDDDFVGPAAPASAGASAHSDGISAAERAFIEREERQREAENTAQAAAEASKTSRPEWMLAPPDAKGKSLAETLAPNGGPLKARGFQQTGARVQKRSGGGAGDEVDDMTLWTETPQQRMERMKNQVIGTSSAYPKTAEKDLEAQREAHRAKLRDEEMRIRAQEASGGSRLTLLEQHQAKRRQEYRDSKRGDGDKSRDDRGSSSGGADSSSSRRRRDRDGDRDREEDGRRHRSSRHYRRDDDGESRRSRHRHHRSDRSRSRSRSRSPGEKRHRDRDRDRDRRDHDRHRSHRDGDRDRDRDRDRKSSSSSRPRPPSPPRRKTGAEKEREAQEARENPSLTMIWDREKAMSFIPIMDQSKRSQTMNDARSGLGDRFGGSSGGSSRYL